MAEQSLPPGILNANELSPEEFDAELARIYDDTAIERLWQEKIGTKPFATNLDLEKGIRTGRLERVEADPKNGYFPIRRLRHHFPGGSYSPAYLRPAPHHILDYVGQKWASEEGHEDDADWLLSVTSMVRSSDYQLKIVDESDRSIAIDPRLGLHSSHEWGWAFDIDALGQYRVGQNGIEPANLIGTPEHADKIIRGRQALRGILGVLQDQEFINFCEEVPDTTRSCFHVCANPLLPPGDVLYGLRLNH